MRVREPLRDPSGQAAAVDRSVNGLGRQGLGLFTAAATGAHEQRLPITQTGRFPERLDLDPVIERVLDDVGDRDHVFAAALAVHAQLEVAGVGARSAEILSAQPAPLRGS